MEPCQRLLVEPGEAQGLQGLRGQVALCQPTLPVSVLSRGSRVGSAGRFTPVG